MSKKLMIIAGAIALLILLASVAVYMSVFGVHISSAHVRWGEFGSFFGGVLSPFYALLGFLALIITVSLQASGLRQAREDFKKSYEATQRELNHLEESSYKEDIFRIINAVDDDLETVLQSDISGGAPRKTTFHQMVHEAIRLRNNNVKEGAYGKFIAAAKDRGSVVEADYSRLVELVYELQRYLELYGVTSRASRRPVVDYFARKNAKLMQIFMDVGGVNQATIDFFSAYTERPVPTQPV